MANKLFVIGINTYQFQNPLKSCVKDVTDFKNLLLEKFDYEENNVIELYNENATAKKILDHLTNYVQTITKEDTLLIYFSGHGHYNKDTDIGYWVPTEGKDYPSWIANDLITSYLDKIQAKHIFLISDSCFSNSILLQNQTKNTKDYVDYDSRWALCSAFENAMDSDGFSNTLFAETILNYLEQSEQDIRVSELIEEVKRNFLANKLQKPQGYPLQVKGHKGGEFVLKIKQSLDNRNLKGYDDFERILKIYKRNSDFTELSKFEDKTNKIGYLLFQEVDNVIKKATYYLYLYEGINQTRTLKHLQENHSIIFHGKNLVTFIHFEKQVKNIEIRKKNISDKFKPINIFLLDQFIREHCTPKVIIDDDSKYLNISNFILPILKEDNSEIKKYYNGWFDKKNEPILVIKGSGGIGKTTLAQYLADITLFNYPSNYVLFIDSIQIKDNLLRNKNRDNLNLYNFYEALYDITDNIEDKLSEELFKINIDAGNILIIIDGLDEVISKIPNFKVIDFLNSIKSSTNELGNGKVIITCRTYFWDKSEFSDDYFSVIELEPFNETQAKEFFKKSFDNDTKKIRKGLKLANDFKYPGNEKENIYHPYVLDIIRSIIELENDNFEYDISDLESKYLNSNNKNDYIVYKVCDRERKRVGQISVDDQIKFFIELAVQKRGLIKTENLKTEIEVALGRKIDYVNSEAFKSHPFLKLSDSSTIFKYDFLTDLFRSIYITTYFNFDSDNFKITKYFIDIINENCWFGSALNGDIVNRITHWNEADMLLISDIIDQIEEFKDIKREVAIKTIANIFNLCLNICHRFNGNNIEMNTALMTSLFSTRKNKIEKLYIININSDQNVRFDFSNLEIHHSIIDSYSGFWTCNFNESTRFINCELYNIKLKDKSTLVNKNNFNDCTFDSNIESSLKVVELKSKNFKENLKVFLTDFFHLFVSNGRLGRQWEHNVIEPRFHGINKINIEYKKVIRALKKSGILEISVELGKNKFSISDKNKSNVEKFIKEGTISNEISAVLNELNK